MKKTVAKRNESFVRPTFFYKRSGRLFFVAASILFALVSLLFFSYSEQNRSAGNGDAVVLASDRNSSSVPQLYCDDPIYYAATDNIIAAGDRAVSSYFCEIRELYGLCAAMQSEALNKLALYSAMSVLVTERGTEPGYLERSTEPGVSELGISEPDISYVCANYTDYTCVDAEKNAKLALNSFINTDSGYEILTSTSAKYYGIASAIRQTAEGCNYCVVLCISSRMTAQDEAEIFAALPEILCLSSELPGYLTSETASTLTVSNDSLIIEKGSNVSEELIAAELGLYNLRGLPAHVSYSRAEASTSQVGERSLNMSTTFGGRIAGGSVNLTVVDSSDFSFSDDLVNLPLIPSGEMWNTAAYIHPESSGQSTTTLCSPAIIGIDDYIEEVIRAQAVSESEPDTSNPEIPGSEIPGSDPRSDEQDSVPRSTVPCSTVKAMVRNSSGVIAEKTLTVVCKDIEYNPVRPLTTDNKNLNVHIETGSTLSEGCHALIAWLSEETNAAQIIFPIIDETVSLSNETGETGDSAAEPGTGDRDPNRGDLKRLRAECYLFTMELPDGTLKTVRKSEPYMVWNPPGDGIVTITAVRYDAAGSVTSSAVIRIDVAKKAEMVYSEAVLTFLSADLRTQETEDGTVLIRGIRAGMSGTAVRDMFAISGGEAPELAVVKADGTTVEGDVVAGTGTIIRLTDGEKVCSELVVVIAGDVNGDGAVGIADFAKLRQQLLRGDVVTGVFVYAADLNNDNSVGIADFAKLRQHLLGVLELN
ncbi:MAG: dockerin type I repeat-containing protein [Clostridia bacterium]|nr:dockerin type I repeat-containing protein [Clostridia bacterium]